MPATARKAPADTTDVAEDQPTTCGARRARRRRMMSRRDGEAALGEIKARNLPADPLIFQAWCVLANAAEKSARLADALTEARRFIALLRVELEDVEGGRRSDAFH